ncbi:MAG TPA: DNA polymerase III subunit epsilon [Micropepsaceae bacterium]|nr:DNA polymerase III subunit epsilon [Micropepsaceae bacterium]
MREIVVDTETTGLKPQEGHRLVDIAAIELVHHLPTGRTFQSYIDPERDVPDDVVKVHGLTGEFLRGKPKFAEIASGFLDFIGDAPLVIHNAPFDLSFINFELERAGHSAIDFGRAIDTVLIARRKFPGARASLDELCKRFNISLAGREVHGALIDADLTAQVYLELIGGRQRGLSFAAGAGDAGGKMEAASARHGERPAPLAPRLTPEDEAAHKALIAKLKGDVLWGKTG